MNILLDSLEEILGRLEFYYQTHVKVPTLVITQIDSLTFNPSFDIDLDTRDGKNALATLFRGMIKEGAKEIVLCCEAWHGVGDGAIAWQQQHGSLTEFPDRRRHIVVVYFSFDTEFIHYADITDRPRKLTWHRTDTTEASFGTFTHLFRQAN